MKERDRDGVPPEGQEGRESQGWGVNRGVAAPCPTREASTDSQTLGDGPSHTGHPPWEGAGDAKPVKQAHLPRWSLLLSDLGGG